MHQTVDLQECADSDKASSVRTGTLSKITQLRHQSRLPDEERSFSLPTTALLKS